MKTTLSAPSLSRLVQLALLGSFLLVIVVFATKSLLQFNAAMADAEGELARIGRVLGKSLNEFTAPEVAIAALRAFEAQIDYAYEDSTLSRVTKRRPKTLAQLALQSGPPIYSNMPNTGWIEQSNDTVRQIPINGVDYWVYARDDAHWRFRLALPYFAHETLLIAAIRDLLPELAIYCPLIMLLTWFSLRVGLRPLRQLCAALQNRDPDDLSPLTMPMRYVELQRVADAWNAQLDKIKTTVLRERAFIHDAAHELRTPMAVMSAEAHVLMSAPDRESRLAAEKAMQDAIGRAAHLAKQLLSLAAMDHADQRHKEPLDAVPFLQTALAQKVPAAQAKRIELELKAPDHYRIESNRVALLSIIDNLVDNAIRYGKPAGRIEVTLDGDAHTMSLTVADDGPGIPASEHERIFERFYRLNRDEHGTGLGLPIVHHAVHSLGGDIAMSDGLDGCGVRFSIRLPISPRTDSTGPLP